MKKDELYDAIAGLDENLQEQAYELEKSSVKTNAGKKSPGKWIIAPIAAAAAFIIVAVVLAVILMPSLQPTNVNVPGGETGHEVLLSTEKPEGGKKERENQDLKHYGQTDAKIHESASGDEHGSPATSPIEFNSFDDLQKALSLQNENTLYSYFLEQGIESKQIENVKFLVNTIRMRNNIVPYLDGDKIELRNEYGFGNITLYSTEKYGLPCIFIHPKVPNGDNLYIKITCIPDEFLSGQRPINASELIMKMAPTYPNIDNFGSYCKNVYNTSVVLRDREVNALVYEYKNSNRNSTLFVYDNLLVEIRNDPKIWGEKWFAALSFGDF